MEKSVIEFDQLVKVGCGIDVHEKSLSVSISSDGKKYQTFSFGTFTEDLLCLQSLLEQENVEGIAMESTGVYWKPVFNILSETIPILLVNARKVKALPGNKTDVKDSRWLCKLLLGGLLQGSFIPNPLGLWHTERNICSPPRKGIFKNDAGKLVELSPLLYYK
jgi:transposase